MLRDVSTPDGARALAAYRPGVGLMMFSRSGLVFVAQRLDSVDAWQMPQGGIDAGESPHAAALRELEEEIGTNHVTVLAESKAWYAYDLPAKLRRKLWGGRFRGQRQKWFALRFEGADRDINIATKHPEFSAWKWAKVAELPDLIVPFKRDLYVALVAEFGHLAASS
jgi:putative (di)nucleoside polyphosphate hydrolase